MDSLGIPTAVERLAGYREALGGAGLPVDPALEHSGARTAEEATEAVAAMLDLPRPADGVLLRPQRHHHRRGARAARPGCTARLP